MGVVIVLATIQSVQAAMESHLVGNPLTNVGFAVDQANHA